MTHTSSGIFIQTQGAAHWLEQLRLRYKLSDTSLRESDNSFTVIIDDSHGTNIWVARYCRVTGLGFIRDRRQHARIVMEAA